MESNVMQQQTVEDLRRDVMILQLCGETSGSASKYEVISEWLGKLAEELQVQAKRG